MSQKDLLHGVIWQQILLFFFPVFFGAIFQQLYNTVDAMIVGNVVGKQALGAVGGSTGTVVNLLVGFMMGLSAGSTVVIAQYYGSGSGDKVKKSVDAGMIIAVSLGFIFTVIGEVGAPQILHLLNVPEEIFAYSLIYMRIYFAGLVPTMIYNTGAGILRAIGDSKRPLYFLIASSIVNIILDILLVAVVHLEVAGAAIATVISQIVSCVLTLYVLSSANDCYRFDVKTIEVDPVIIKQIVRIGLPAGIQSCLYSIANLFIQAAVNSYGTDTVAAYTAFGKIDALFWNYNNALGTSVLTFCGQNFGARNIKRVKDGVKESAIIYIIGSILISSVSILCGNFLYNLFTNDTEVIRIGMGLLKFIGPYWVTFVAVEVLSSAIRSCGDAIVPMMMTAVGIGALRIIWIVFYPATSIYQTLACFPISWVLTGIFFVVYYLRGNWLKKCLKDG